jgi:hypothetical protein
MKKWLAIGVALLGMGVLGACTPLPKPLPQPPKPVCKPGLTLARFNQIRTGMTNDQIVRIFCGLPGKVTSHFVDPGLPAYGIPAHDYIDVEWDGPNYSVVWVDFDNGRATSYWEVGL